ncbi:MAG: 50S ribosome-binding GTPase [Planctomycetia bacterium]|nr:50S ribosome-binding GTPase [Planctomycetia bacterium]
MSEQTPLYFSRLTPPGRGAVGTILLEGENAFDLFCRLFRLANGQSLISFEKNKLSTKNIFENWNSKPLFGHFCLDESTFEEVVVHLESEKRIEIHSHGGDSVFQAIALVLKKNGAIPLPSLSNNYQTTSEEALALLPFAKTEKTTQILLDQFSGVLDQEIFEIQKSISNIELSSSETTSKNFPKLLARIDHLLSLANWGEHLVQPFRILLLGPTNAGKSSLINALSGFDRTIVDRTAGTTRDAISVEIVINGWPFILTDTAGFRQTDQILERIGINKTFEQIAFSDLFLFVFDITSQESDPFQTFYQFLLKKKTERPINNSNALLILNKCDLAEKQWNPFWIKNQKINSFDSPILTSVKTNQGLFQLKEKIVQQLIPDFYREGEAVPFLPQHRIKLEQLRKQLLNANDNR